MKQPTVKEICEELARPTDLISFCRNIRDERFHSWQQPEQLYFAALGGMWLRVDGSEVSFALRGGRKFGRHSRQRIAAAVNDWRRNKLYSYELIDWKMLRDISETFSNNTFRDVTEQDWRMFANHLMKEVR